MTDNRKAALALILGSLGDIVTMAIHPTGAGSLTAAQADRLATASAIAHSLAMASLLVTFLGALQLTRHLAAYELPPNPQHPHNPELSPNLELPHHQELPQDRDHLALAALVTYAFAGIAILIATAVSGFITPNILHRMATDAPANTPQWTLILIAVVQFNHAFAAIYSVAASLAIILWSASALRNGGFGRRIAIYGCTVPVLVIILIAIGHLRLNVHGMAAVVLAHAIWFVLVAAQLYRNPNPGR